MVKKLAFRIVYLILSAILITLIVGIPVYAAYRVHISEPIKIRTATFNWSYGVGDNPQKHVYYANGRHWIWYCDETFEIKYYSSSDLSSWTLESTGVGFDYTNDLAVTFDGTYFHYSRELNNNLYYRRGIPNNDGTITWSAAEQTVLVDAVVNGNVSEPSSIIVDSIGHVYIGYRAKGTYLPRVIRNDDLDGTWTTSAGFPYQLQDLGQGKPLLLLMPGDDVYAIVTVIASDTFGWYYNGTNWGARETITTIDANAQFYSTSAVQHNGIVEFVWLGENPDYYIRCATRNILGVWTYGETTGALLDANTTPLLGCIDGSDLFLAYAHSDCIYYTTRNSGVWDTTPQILIDETTDNLYEPNYELSLGVVGNREFGIVYITGVFADSDLNYILISFSIPPRGFNLMTIIMPSCVAIGTILLVFTKSENTKDIIGYSTIGIITIFVILTILNTM